MQRSVILQTIIDMVPADFADPNADYRAVRRMMAPFHSHPVSGELNIERIEYGGAPCGDYTITGITNDK